MSSAQPGNVKVNVPSGDGLPENPSATDTKDFAQFRIEVYCQENWSAFLLSLYFAEDFGCFSLDMFGFLRQDTRQRLRAVLRDKWVSVERRREAITSDALYPSAQEELEWPVEEKSIHPEYFKGSNLRSPAPSPLSTKETFFTRKDFVLNPVSGQ